jgi:predicted metalloenzyme YecM
MPYLLDKYSGFLDEVFANLQSVGIDVTGCTIDHIAMRTQTPDDYQKFLKEYTSNNELIGENIVRERPIAIIKFKTPLIYEDFQIPFFELMAPAGDFTHPNGLEHVEIIVPDLDEFQKKYSQVEFNLKSRDRKINPELILTFPNHANVKFHIRPIDEAFHLQKKLGIL